MDIEEDSAHVPTRTVTGSNTQQVPSWSANSFAVSSKYAEFKAIPVSEDQMVIQQLMSWSLAEKHTEAKTSHGNTRYDNTPEKCAYMRWNVSMDSPQTKKKDLAAPIEDSRYKTPQRRAPRLTNEQLEKIEREDRDNMRGKMRNMQVDVYHR